jgi:TetR/AcrR family transcriptional regulator, regulator of cefoperazone and chloramphenicol sensitivity
MNNGNRSSDYMAKRVRPGKAASSHGKSAAARQTLVLATIDILKNKSIDAISTREIASKSKQNISAINYYFGGKEGLYIAAVQHIGNIIQQRLYPILFQAEKLTGSKAGTSEEAIDFLKRLMRQVIAFHNEILGFTEIIAREQIHPTKAFAILFDGALHELQLCGAKLVALAVGGDGDDDEFKIRFHAILGQAVIFRLARETILRGVGWKDIGERETDIVATIIEEHIEFMMAALREKKAHAKAVRPQVRAKRVR